MKKLKMMFTVLLAMFILGGCSLNNSNKTALIVVNNEPITKQEFDKAFDEVAKNPMFTQIGVDLKNDPNSFLYLLIMIHILSMILS